MIEQIIITSLVITGAYTAMSTGMILDWIPRVFSWIPEKLQQPLFGCCLCMSSVWGSAMWWLMNWNCSTSLIWWPVHVLGVCGAMWVIYKTTDL